MWQDLMFRARSLFRPRQVEAELDDELRFHAERQLCKYLESGMTREEARRRVRLEFGGLDQVKEDCRDARGISVIETLRQDLRYGLRTLRKSPGFTIAAILALGIGIGSVTAIFSILDGIVLRPLPFKDPSRLVMLWETNTAKSLDHEPISPVRKATREYASARSARCCGSSPRWSMNCW